MVRAPLYALSQLAGQAASFLCPRPRQRRRPAGTVRGAGGRRLRRAAPRGRRAQKAPPDSAGVDLAVPVRPHLPRPVDGGSRSIGRLHHCESRQNRPVLVVGVENDRVLSQRFHHRRARNCPGQYRRFGLLSTKRAHKKHDHTSVANIYYETRY
jgi:hypothetical protein